MVVKQDVNDSPVMLQNPIDEDDDQVKEEKSTSNQQP
jgi:hypothetical protein